MLVLSRKVGESIVIGQDIHLSILEIRGDQIKLGFQAPRSVTIHRFEVFEDIRQANLLAGQEGVAVSSKLAPLGLPQASSSEEATGLLKKLGRRSMVRLSSSSSVASPATLPPKD
jgi:carbon storage regulator